MPGHRHSSQLVPVVRDGQRLLVCTDCVLSSDKRLDNERQAWETVEQSAADAFNALFNANEGFPEQALLLRLMEKAQAQQKLWESKS